MYTKDGVGFEGISMMQKDKTPVPKMVGVILAMLVGIGLLGYAASVFFGEKSENAEKPAGVTILPTPARKATTEPTFIPTNIFATAAISSSPPAKLSPTKTLTPTAKISPTVKTTARGVTPTAAVTESLKLEVLNGSGVKGAAKTLANALTAEGYTITRTGNADAYTYEGVTITGKKSQKIAIEQLKKDLAAHDYIVKTTTLTLDETATYDATVIIGAE